MFKSLILALLPVLGSVLAFVHQQQNTLMSSLPKAATGKSFYALGVVHNQLNGVDELELSVFIQSWLHHSPDTRLVLFVDSPERYPILADLQNVETIPVKWDPNLTPMYQRHFLYKDYIEKQQHAMAGVALTDVRDVVLQGNPWKDSMIKATILRNGALFSMEGGAGIGGQLLIGNSSHSNGGKVARCLGEDIRKRLSDEIVSCTGVTIGTPDALLRYLNRMIETINDKISPQCIKSGRGDQAAHNYVLHVLSQREKEMGLFATPSIWKSPIHTAHYGFPLEINRYSIVKRQNGSTPVIIHQWDRSKDLQKRYAAMYGLWTDGEYKGFSKDMCKGCPIVAL